MTGQEIVSHLKAVDILRVPREKLAQFGHLNTEARGILFKCGFWQDDKLVKRRFLSQNTDFNRVKPYFPSYALS